MENIFYTDAKNIVMKFLEEEFEDCSSRFKNRFLYFFNSLVNYEEEGVKMRPQILITNNIDLIIRNIPQSYKITLFNDETDSDFNSRMKAMIPFSDKDWCLYVNMEEEGAGISYGIVKVMNSIKEEPFKELLLNSAKLKEKIGKLDAVIVEPLSSHQISLNSLSGKGLNINFALDTSEVLDKNAEIDAFVDASFTKLKTTEKKLNEIKIMYKNIFTNVSKNVKGAICVIVDKDYVDNGFFSDGVWLKEPIGFSKLFLNTKSYSEFKLNTIANLFISMLNFDGITIIDNTGRIRAYNVFVETNLQRTKNIIGGARKRAAYTIINSRRKNIKGVYFQSHEGEIFYEPVKK